MMVSSSRWYVVGHSVEISLAVLLATTEVLHDDHNRHLVLYIDFGLSSARVCIYCLRSLLYSMDHRHCPWNQTLRPKEAETESDHVHHPSGAGVRLYSGGLPFRDNSTKPS